jgi:hypothetical protein
LHLTCEFMRQRAAGRTIPRDVNASSSIAVSFWVTRCQGVGMSGDV